MIPDTISVTQPLSEHVKTRVELYLSHLEGFESTGLYSLVLAEIEKPLLEATLAHAGFNQTKTAQILGMSRSTLRKKLEHYNLS